MRLAATTTATKQKQKRGAAADSCVLRRCSQVLVDFDPLPGVSDMIEAVDTQAAATPADSKVASGTPGEVGGGGGGGGKPAGGRKLKKKQSSSSSKDAKNSKDAKAAAAAGSADEAGMDIEMELSALDDLQIGGGGSADEV